MYSQEVFCKNTVASVLNMSSEFLHKLDLGHKTSSAKQWQKTFMPFGSKPGHLVTRLARTFFVGLSYIPWYNNGTRSERGYLEG